MLNFSGPARLAVFAIILVTFLTGCGDKLDPTEPEGAFNIFRNALFAGEADTMWSRMSPSSHEYFDGQLQRLQRMDEKIQRYLPPTDHKLARKQAGSVLTDELKSGEALFKYIFKPANLPQDEKYKVGMDVEEIKISEDEKQAAVVTRGKQEILLVHDETSDEWFVSFVGSSDAIPNAMAWVLKNEEALDKTIDDLIAEERRERETIISELFGYKAEASKE